MKPSMWPIRTPLRPTEQSPPRSRVADLPSSGSLISAPLEGSPGTLDRANASPPRSRTADLPSSGWPISASLEAVSRHKGQTAPPPNRPPYEGIKSQPLRHGSKDGRRQTATPAVDVTGVPSTDPGHRSATPVAVATLWSIQCGTRQVGAAPVTVLPTPTIQTISRWGRGLAMSRALPRGALCMRGRDPGPPSCGVRDFHAVAEPPKLTGPGCTDLCC